MFNNSCVISLLFKIVPVLESIVCACFHIRLLISPQICFAKSGHTNFVNITFYCLFSSEEVLRGLSKKNVTKEQIEAKIQVTLKYASVRKHTEETMIHRLSQQIIATKLSYQLTLLAPECVFHKFCCFDFRRSGGFSVNFTQISYFNLFFLLIILNTAARMQRRIQNPVKHLRWSKKMYLLQK